MYVLNIPPAPPPQSSDYFQRRILSAKGSNSGRKLELPVRDGYFATLPPVLAAAESGEEQELIRSTAQHTHTRTVHT